MQLACLSGIFNTLNIRNTSLQGSNNNTVELCDKLKAFIRKVEIWQIKVENSNAGMFPALKQFIECNNTAISEAARCYILNHLSLKFHFENYFSDMDIKYFDWIRYYRGEGNH
jgi:hypothetical protein